MTLASKKLLAALAALPKQERRLTGRQNDEKYHLNYEVPWYADWHGLPRRGVLCRNSSWEEYSKLILQITKQQEGQ